MDINALVKNHFDNDWLKFYGACQKSNISPETFSHVQAILQELSEMVTFDEISKKDADIIYAYIMKNMNTVCTEVVIQQDDDFMDEYTAVYNRTIEALKEKVTLDTH